MCVDMQGREGKVTQVYRKKWVIHIERVTREKVNGECPVAAGSGAAPLPVQHSHVSQHRVHDWLQQINRSKREISNWRTGTGLARCIRACLYNDRLWVAPVSKSTLLDPQRQAQKPSTQQLRDERFWASRLWTASCMTLGGLLQ
jgi:ribosomal protein L24